MCGIAGILDFKRGREIPLLALKRMAVSQRHRGPDGFGIYRNRDVGLAHTRLSIIDLEGGAQPIHNEDKTIWVVFNGEIYNFPELRAELQSRGHRFSTRSDTEVLVHLYEEEGENFLSALNGEFAIALYDKRRKNLFLARDRLGIRPLFYAVHDGRFYFASEIKAIFSAEKAIPRKVNAQVLSEIFTLWMPAGEETIFQGIRQLGAGKWARVSLQGKMEEKQYWDIPIGQKVDTQTRSEDEYAEELLALLVDSVRLRLRSDVPVGSYLSGGLDSSAITSLVKKSTDNPLETFSVTFSDNEYDESKQQKEVVDYLKTVHHSMECTYSDITDCFPDVIWHTETPILRTAPAPLYLLSSLVQRNKYKVVLSGEGADEFFGGYDIYKEAKVRAFIGKNSDSSFRSLLLKRLYPYLALSPTSAPGYAKRFFDVEASPEEDLFYAHRPRWKTTEWSHTFFTHEITDQFRNTPSEGLQRKMSERLRGLDYFHRAQYVEARTLLGNYLLSSQGDRMAMANSVESRYPFLDHRLVELSCIIPRKFHMKGLNEKNMLKHALKGLIPESILKRKKQPYMAPDLLSFFAAKEPEYLKFFLSKELLKEAGMFRETAVDGFVKRCRMGKRQGFRENMAFIGILSAQILYSKFIKSFRCPDVRTLSPGVNCRVIDESYNKESGCR